MDTTEWIREHSWVLGPAFIATLILILWVKSRLVNNIEIKPVDVGIALIPFVLWMATAGILKKVELPGIGALEMADVFVAAAAVQIESQVSETPVTELVAERKRGVGDIPKLIASGTQVLSFTLGFQGYDTPSVWMYFNHLIKSPTFKYALLNDKNGSLFGLFDARGLTVKLNPDNNEELMRKHPLKPYEGLPDKQQVKKWLVFTKFIKDGMKEELTKTPGFVSFEKSVLSTTDKKTVLKQMEKYNLDWLPVVDKSQGIYQFRGIVERSRVTASLILDVTTSLESKEKENED